MRKRTLLAGLTLTALIAGAGVDVGFGVSRSLSFEKSAGSLQDTWTRDVSEGVPDSSITPLREQLASGRPAGSWWSPSWIRSDGASLISDLQARTDAAFAAALADARQRAEAAQTAFTTYADGQPGWIPAATASDVKLWPTQLSGAGTPAAASALAVRWTATLASTKTEVAVARTSQNAQLLDSAGGRAGLVGAAARLARTARADNLDSSTVDSLLGRVSTEADNGGPPTQADEELLAGVSALQALIDLNDNLARQMRPLYLTVLQARAEGIPSASTFNDQYSAASTHFQAGRTNADLTAVQQQVNTLQSSMGAELRTNSCGHNVPAGKVITINLTFQEMLFFQDGCVVQATPVSSGRPQLPTPPGSYRIFSKQSPFIFHSAWPKGSPFWYPDSPVSWVMEFAGGGYFIHDAPWEAGDAYGPGSQNSNYSASHGCVHTPTSVMQWAYSWTPYGTPVIIS